VLSSQPLSKKSKDEFEKKGLFDIIGVCEAGIHTLLLEYLVYLSKSDQFVDELVYRSPRVLP
jgi:hypothetical protein